MEASGKSMVPATIVEFQIIQEYGMHVKVITERDKESAAEKPLVGYDIRRVRCGWGFTKKLTCMSNMQLCVLQFQKLTVIHLMQIAIKEKSSIFLMIESIFSINLVT